MNLTTDLHGYALRQPEKTALCVQEKDYNYAQLTILVAQLAGWITTVTDGQNPRIGILASRSLEAYSGVLAAAWSGATYVPLNPKYPRQRLTEIINQAELDALILDDSSAAQLFDELKSVLPTKVIAPASEQGKLELCDVVPLTSPVPVQPDALAYLMFTSGTTGKPKGITVSVGNVQHMLDTLKERYRITPADRLSQFFELSFDLSVFDIFMAFNNGASLHVVPEHCLMAPTQFIRQQDLTVWFSVPSLIGMLGKTKLLKANSLPSLRLSLFCGEALPVTSALNWQTAAPNSTLENLYGPTEATVACLVQNCSDPTAVTAERGIVAIGTPFCGHEAAIVDEHGNFLKTGHQGELAICGPQVAPGYLKNTALTEKRFPLLQHPKKGESRWYLTGDCSVQDEKGRFHFLGRIDNQVKIRGQRIELDEVEYHLRNVSGCECVVAMLSGENAEHRRHLIGILETPKIDSDALKQKLSMQIPAYMVPQRLLAVQSLPRNLSGKIDRKAASELLLRSPSETAS